MGGGKTLSMMGYALLLAAQTDQDVHANFHLNVERTHYYERWRELENVENAIVLFDELDKTADARMWKSKEQIYFTHLFTQFRKKGVTFMYSSQRVRQVEVRVRENSDYVCECAKIYTKNLIINQWWDTQRGQELPIKKRRLVNTDPSRLYDFYDSFEVVKSHLSMIEA